METVRHIVGQTRQRLIARLVASHAGTGSAIGASVACLLASGAWLFLSEASVTGLLPFGLSASWLPLTAAAVGGLIGALAGTARAIWLRPSLTTAAAELDHLAKLNDALSSALAFAARPTSPGSSAQVVAEPAPITAGLQQAAMNDAERLARALSPRALIPLSPPRAWPLTLAALALAAGFPQIAPLGWLRSQPSPAQLAANPPPQTAEQLAESVRATEALAAAIAARQAAPDPAAPDASAAAERPADEAIRRELATLEQIKRELEGGPKAASSSPSAEPSAPGSARTGRAQTPAESPARPAPQRAAESLNRLADAVTEQARTAQAAADGLRERLRSAADELGAAPAPSPAGSSAPSESLANRGREIADALSRGDVATAQRKLDELASELPSASEEDRNKLARDLSRFAEGLDKPSPSKQPNAASSPTGDPQSSPAAQQLEQAGLSPERARALAEQLGSATKPEQRAAAEDAARRDLQAQGRSEQDAADRARQAANAASEQAKQADAENQTRQRSKTLAERLRDLAEQVKAKQQREKEAQQPKPSQPPQQPEPASPPAADPASRPPEQPNSARDPAQSKPSQTQPSQTDPAQTNPSKPESTGQPDRARENGKQPQSQPSDPSSSPGERSTQPSQNGQPGESKQPGQQNQPAQQNQPGQQNQPSQQNQPGQSGTPSQQDQPDQPTKPAPSGQSGERFKPSDGNRNTQPGKPQPANSPSSTPSKTPTPGSQPDASKPPSATGQPAKPESDPNSPSASPSPSDAEKPTGDPAKSPPSNTPSPRDGSNATPRPSGNPPATDPSSSKTSREAVRDKTPDKSPNNGPDKSPDAAPNKRPGSRPDNKQDKTPGNTPSPTPTEQHDKGAEQPAPSSPSQRTTPPPANADEAIRKMREELDRLDRDSNAPTEAARDSKALRDQAKRLIDGMDDKQRQEAMELARRYAERSKARAQPEPNDRRAGRSPSPSSPDRPDQPQDGQSQPGQQRTAQSPGGQSPTGPIDPPPGIAKQFGLQEANKGPSDRLSPMQSKQDGTLDARRPGNSSGPQRTLAEWSGNGGKVQPAQQADATEIIESAAAGAQQAIEREQVPRRLEDLVTKWYRRLPQAVGLPPAAPAKPPAAASPASPEPSGGTKP